jgi:hypothetical protein
MAPAVMKMLVNRQEAKIMLLMSTTQSDSLRVLLQSLVGRFELLFFFRD